MFFYESVSSLCSQLNVVRTSKNLLSGKVSIRVGSYGTPWAFVSGWSSRFRFKQIPKVRVFIVKLETAYIFVWNRYLNLHCRLTMIAGYLLFTSEKKSLLSFHSILVFLPSGRLWRLISISLGYPFGAIMLSFGRKKIDLKYTTIFGPCLSLLEFAPFFMPMEVNKKACLQVENN